MIRITKRQAQKRFADGKPAYLCPCKLHPFPPFSSACLIMSTEWKERAAYYADNHNPHLWKGSIDQTAWALMYSSWAFYNATYETGYYAHYYQEST